MTRRSGLIEAESTPARDDATSELIRSYGDWWDERYGAKKRLAGIEREIEAARSRRGAEAAKLPTAPKTKRSNRNPLCYYGARAPREDRDYIVEMWRNAATVCQIRTGTNYDTSRIWIILEQEGCLPKYNPDLSESVRDEMKQKLIASVAGRRRQPDAADVIAREYGVSVFNVVELIYEAGLRPYPKHPMTPRHPKLTQPT